MLTAIGWTFPSLLWHYISNCSKRPQFAKLPASSPQAPRKLPASSSQATRKLLASSSQATRKLLASSSQAPRKLLASSSQAPRKLLASYSQATRKLLASYSQATRKLLASSSQAPRKLLASSSQAPENPKQDFICTLHRIYVKWVAVSLVLPCIEFLEVWQFSSTHTGYFEFCWKLCDGMLLSFYSISSFVIADVVCIEK